jgi:5-methylcytosine-specific restriction endonuclease McrA
VPRRTWTDDDLRAAVPDARSWSDVVRSLGLALGGSSRPRLLRRADELGLDISHLDAGPGGGAARRRWTDDELCVAVASSRNLKQVFDHLGLRVGGGVWTAMKSHIQRLELSTEHWYPHAARPIGAAPAIPRWSEEELRSAADSARSIAQIMRRVGLDPRSRRGRGELLRRLAELGFDVTDLPGQAWARGHRRTGRPRRPLQELLVRGSDVPTSRLRERLIEEEVLEARCSSCGLEEWLGGPIPLQLDHIDGDRTNNELENLRLLCPNCHALTDTYCGRNIGRR